MARLDRNPPVNFAALFFTRWLMCGALVFGTYNPSGTSYYDWIANTSGGITPLQIFTGILIFTVAVSFIRSAYLSAGYLGTATILGLIFMAIVLTVGLGITDFEHIAVTEYMIEFWISLTLAIGTSWADAQRKLSGERDVLKSPP